MIENGYSRTKMRGFVMGLEAAKHMINLDDDVPTFHEDVNERIEACCKEWNIKPPEQEEAINGS